MKDTTENIEQSMASIPVEPVQPSSTTGVQRVSRARTFKLLALLLMLACFVLLLLSFSALYVRQQVQQSATAEFQSNQQDEQLVQVSAPPVVQAAQVVKQMTADVQWQDDQFSYDVQQVYVLPEPMASLAAELTPAHQLLVFAVQVTDTRTFGAARVVPTRNYVNIRRSSQDVTPFGVDTTQLEPGGSTTVFIPFELPTDEQMVSGLLGNLRNPYVVQLDFARATLLDGSFDLTNGFQPVQSQGTESPVLDGPLATPTLVQ